MTLHGTLGDIAYAAMPLPTDLIPSSGSLTPAQLADVASLTLPKRRAERAAVYILINKFIRPGLLLAHHPDGAPYLIAEDTGASATDADNGASATDADNGASATDAACLNGAGVFSLCSKSAGVPASFSLSHCPAGVAIAWSYASIPLGIDIEIPSPKLPRIAPRFVNPADRPADLLPLWVIKEAVYKALRTPALSLTDIIVTPSAAPATYTAAAPSAPSFSSYNAATPSATLAAVTFPALGALIALAFQPEWQGA